MGIGIDGFAAALRDPKSGIELTPNKRMANLLKEVETADALGLDAFGVGERYSEEFLDAALTVILGAAAAHKAHPPDQRSHRAQRRRSDARLSGLRHPRPDLARPRRDRCRARLVQRGACAFLAGP